MSALIEAPEVYEQLGRDGIRLVDATYPFNPRLYEQARIGNAVPFDIDTVCDRSSPLPHMLPDPQAFSASAGAMGIGHDDTVIVYDRSGIVMAASRVWWMFRVFGHRRVFILNGGLPAWSDAELPLNTAPPCPVAPAFYQACFHPALLKSRQDIQNALSDPKTLILDARPPERFCGISGEPRPAMRAGHIPGSINLPFSLLIDPATARLLAGHPQIEDIRTHSGDIITSCGSGVTACVLALALFESGRKDAAVYDGSWAEWGAAQSGLPIEV